jgi:hypothetical protein
VKTAKHAWTGFVAYDDWSEWVAALV